MIKMIAKTALWVAVGCVAIGTAIDQDVVQTPWVYTVQSTITPGSSITITQPHGDPFHVEATQATSKKHTVDVGEPVILAALYLVGSAMGYGLKTNS